MFITPKEWLALSLRNRMLLLEAVANKNKQKRRMRKIKKADASTSTKETIRKYYFNTKMGACSILSSLKSHLGKLRSEQL